MLRRTILKLFGTSAGWPPVGVECGKADVKVVSGDRYREIGVLEVSKASSFENFESRIGLCASDRAKSTMAETCQQAR